MTETSLTQISEHVYWLPPGKPDRPSLCAVVGENLTLALDSGASAAHAQLFLDGLAAHHAAPPSLIALTHWHWDHVFGADRLGVPVIAQAQTADQLARMAAYDWSDAGLEAHIAAGEQTAAGAEHIKQELPAPREVRITVPSIVFEANLELRLGGVICAIQHVGGDHAADSSVMFVLPDRVLFIGDCLYDAIYTPKRHYTRKNLLPLIERLRAFDAEYVIEGHTDTVMSWNEFINLTDQMRLACRLIEQFGDDEAAILAAAQAEIGAAPDEDAVYFVRALIAGREYE